MKQNYKNTVLGFLKISLLLSFLLVEIFGFTNTIQAQTTCNYQIQFGSNNYSIAYTGMATLTASVSGSGSCGSSVGFNLLLVSSSSPGGRSISDKSSNLQNNAGNTTFQISPQSYKSDIDSSNNLTFQITIDGNPAKSAPLIINVTGIPTPTLTVLPVQVSFSNNAGIFNNGDTTNVTASLQVNGNTASQLQSVQTAYFGLYVNNSAQAVAGFDNITIANLLGSPQTYNGLVINTANGFKTGPNTVTVKFYQSGTSNEIGEGSAILTVQGITTPPTPTVTTDKSSYNIGDTMTLTFANLPSGASGQVCINYVAANDNSCYPVNSGQTSFQLAVTTANGFNASGSNTIAVDNFMDSNGNQINFSAGNTITVTTGSSGATGATVTCTGTGQGSCANGQTCTNGICQGATSGQSSNSGTTLYNPLPEADLTHVFLVVAQGFLGIMGIVAVLFIIVGGFQMVLAAGNEETYLKAKKTIVWAILGLAVAILSFSIVAIVESLLQANIQPADSTSTTQTTTNPTTPQGTIPNGSPQGTIPNGTPQGTIP